ncbi:hypothetical protein AAVH_02369 [Aphelenchoides avenae]|nr:hypothetical protein AAVH_02369 [Aphelenchus avenae]
MLHRLCARSLLSLSLLYSLVQSLYVIGRYDPNMLANRMGVQLFDVLESSPLLMNENADRDFAQEAPSDDFKPNENKRSAASAKGLPAHEHVCNTVIRTDYQPKLGHEQNGSRVEIQQDDRRSFRATFVECENTQRESCHGIDNSLFTSECITLYEYRPAGVRLEGGSGDFIDGFIKVPITCQCRLRRKLNRIMLTNE